MVYNKRSTIGLLLGILLLSAALVWHDLGTHEVLGRDENATITKIDQPDLASVLQATTMKVTGQPGNMQPLYFFLQHLLLPVIERSLFAFRFLSSAFGILVVALTLKLGEVLWDSETGLVGALLTALLPFHVRYAQIARPYTLLADGDVVVVDQHYHRCLVDHWSMVSSQKYVMLQAVSRSRPATAGARPACR